MEHTIETLTQLIGYAPPENSIAFRDGIPYVVDGLDEDVDEEAVEWALQAQRIVLFS